MYGGIARAHEMFVASRQYVFEQHGDPIRDAGAAVALTWAMCSRADGSIAGTAPSRPVIDLEFGFDKAADAYPYFREGNSFGKAVVIR